MDCDSVKEVSSGKAEMASAKNPPGSNTPAAIVYLECLKNHAAAIGSHAVDGCCEFIANSDDSMKCGACGCHRNFHRPETKGGRLHLPPSFCAGCCGGLHPPAAADPPRLTGGPEPLKSVLPQSAGVPSPYSASAPQMLLALSGNAPSASAAAAGGGGRGRGSSGKKRPRTKFSEEQKAKMSAFAEKIGWTLRGGRNTAVSRFCEETGIKRSVLKVWVHNNKHSLGKKAQEEDGNSTPPIHH